MTHNKGRVHSASSKQPAQSWHRRVTFAETPKNVRKGNSLGQILQDLEKTQESRVEEEVEETRNGENIPEPQGWSFQWESPLCTQHTEKPTRRKTGPGPRPVWKSPEGRATGGSKSHLPTLAAADLHTRVLSLVWGSREQRPQKTHGLHLSPQPPQEATMCVLPTN